MTERKPAGVGTGVLVGLGLHLPGQLLVLLLEGLFWSEGQAGAALLLFAGFTQVLYMLPAAIVFGVRGQAGLCKGVLLVMGIGILLTGICTLGVMASFG